MNIHLYPTLALGADETPMGYASRLARLHNCAHLRNFCADMGLAFQPVVDGDATEIRRLAQLSGANAIDLQRNAVVRDGTDYRIRGEKLSKAATALTHVRICPRCAAEAMHDNLTLPIEIAIHDQVQWKIGSIRTCALHDVALIDLGVADKTTTIYDFSGFIAGKVDEFEDLPDIEREASAFEHYLIGRLNGAPKTHPFLDGLEFHAAAKLCEVLGAVEIDGRHVAVKNYSENDWHKAGQADSRSRPAVNNRSASSCRSCRKRSSRRTAWPTTGHRACTTSSTNGRRSRRKARTSIRSAIFSDATSSPPCRSAPANNYSARPLKNA